ncbi:hypothetical protein F5884DRAFT_768641 [Xylogone sp. PMI_703]|nr:hypothetical protein F5884DRAFT_768641 [Xylogone sp. PMI_703]
MSSSLPIEIAETIQTASIKRNPSPTHDINPSTAASTKKPVTVSRAAASDSSLNNFDYEADDGIDEEDEEDIPEDILRPIPRRASFGPLPDLRFEQSYLASIAAADSRWKVVYITVRDQVMLPLLQGMIWSLALHGWRYWNKNARLSGTSTGAKIRRWWYRTNNWPIEDSFGSVAKNKKLAADVGEFYQNQNSGGD